jgi:hypothetical protein
MPHRILVTTIALLSLLLAPALRAEGPVVADVRDGPCHMVISGEYAIFSVRVEGLVPGELMSFESISNGERMADTRSASADGTWGSVLLTQVLGSNTGTTTVTIKSSRCTLKATFPWSADE